MKNSPFLTLALAFSLASLALGSQLLDYQFQAPSLGGELVPVRVYLPTGYGPTGSPYRLYIFLHGCCGLNQTSHSGVMKTALDARIDSGQIDPMVVVWPAGLGSDFSNRHMWTDSERNGDYESLVVVDLLDWLSSSGLNISQARGQRAIGGFSMGGDGAIRMAIRNCDKCIAFVSHSGGPAVQWFRTRFSLVIDECPEERPPYTYDPTNGSWTEVFFGAASAFSPNMTNFPWYLDFPLLSNGEVDESVFTDRWVENHDPATLIADPEIYTHEISMYFEVGESDPFMYDSNVLFDQELQDLGVPHTYNTFSGGHELTAARVEVTLDWLDEVMDAAAVGVPDVAPCARRSGLTLSQNVPNPAWGDVRFPFHLGGASTVSLQVFDASGRRVATLLQGTLAAGDHQTSWNVSSLAAGVYLYRLRTEQETAARRMTVDE